MDINQEILKALQDEESIMLATIVSTSGSTPAAALSKMLIKEGGAVSVGTVGGGCMEGDVLHAARRLYRLKKADVLTFQLDETNLDQGLICGGNVEILIESIDRTQAILFGSLKDLQDAGEDVVLATYLPNDGIVKWKFVLRPAPLDVPMLHPEVVVDAEYLISQIPDLRLAIPEELQKVDRLHQTCRLDTSDGTLILEPVLGAPSLIIFGGGHVSKYLSKAASLVGFRVTVVDDRPEYANAQRFPEAVRTLAVDFTEAFDQISIFPSTYVAIVTRGHRSDEEILEQALKRPAKYIGMIGSKRKILTTYEHLLERGISAESLKRVHAPMGLEIGARTAEEIAVSIVSELIALRRGEDKLVPHKSKMMEEVIALLEKHAEVH